LVASEQTCASGSKRVNPDIPDCPLSDFNQPVPAITLDHSPTFARDRYRKAKRDAKIDFEGMDGRTQVPR
jgi:hypothetical protein